MSFDLSFWKTVAVFSIVSFLPILGWIYFFQSQNYERKRYVVITFLAGMMSIIPIKIYEKYWDLSIWYLEHLNLFKHFETLVSSSTLAKVVTFSLVSILVSFFMFVFSALIIFILEIFSRENTARYSYFQKIKKISESPFLFVSIGVLLGLVSSELSVFFPEKVWFFVVVGMIEEFAKYLMLRFADEDRIKCVSDAISFSIIIALGFAFVENVIYLSKFWLTAQQNFSNVAIFFILRSTISTIAHVCFSSIMGYFYGIAHFSSEIYAEESREKKHPILRKLHQIFHIKVSPLFHEEKLLEGLLLAMVIHAIFNSLLEFGLVAVIIPFLIGIFIIILNLLHRRDNHIRRGNLLKNIS